MIYLNKDDEHSSWFFKLKQLLNVEPQNKDQLIDLLRDAHLRSLINSETLTMIEGAMLFAQMQVRDIMLPKQQIICIKHDASLDEIIPIVTSSGHSRFPVTGDNPDEVIGILHAKDLLRYQSDNYLVFDLQDLIRQPTYVPESKRLDLLLSEFRSNRNHLAIVVDEYGAVSGFVTLEDLIEQIVGDISDEFDIDEEAYIKIHADEHYIIKAQTPIAEFNQQVRAHFSDELYDTMGGIIMTNFGYLPKCGEKIVIDNFEFKILNADSRKINLIECFDQRNL